MVLDNPVTITPPPITKQDGTVKTFNSFTLNDLDITIIDNAKRKVVSVQIARIPRSLVLWTKEVYDSIGDYTQVQVENRVKELLGNDPQKVLEGLFVFQR